MQFTLDIDKTEEEQIKECINFLREKRYIVLLPNALSTTSVKNPTTLVDLFYSMLQYHNRNRKIHYDRATKKEISLAKKFIERRKSICGNKKQALKESAAIVKCVVENESLFCFLQPLHSFNCFGHETMKWVVDKAISIINGENEEINERDYILFMEELGKQQEVDSLNSLGIRIEKMKGYLGGSNGEGKG
ncbi:MAG: hypothetical protein KAS32_30680 [Candidatus Peribacteraceae bacterium]|nr:hypothetical protein [Candidatus Peribacteraceae bacterium]